MNPNNVKLSIQIISDAKDILHIEDEWNLLVSVSCKKPFLLNNFVKEFINSFQKGWTPLILVISSKKKILGIAPLVIKTKFGIRSVTFSNPTWCSDFIINLEHRKICIAAIIDFLFNTLNCKYADFTLSYDSSNFELLKNQCKLSNINIKILPQRGRRIIPITCSWSKFVSTLGNKYKKKMKINENKLTRVGSVKVVCADIKEHPEALKKIVEVERNSWKGKIWAQKEGEIDNEVLLILKGSQNLSQEPKIKWNTWFLELNSKTIAYCITTEYCNEGFLVKTSYNEQYKKLYPGIFLQNAIIQELFNAGRVKCIDFLSDLHYQKTWANKCVPRVTIKLAKGVLPVTIKSMSENIVIRKILNKLL